MSNHSQNMKHFKILLLTGTLEDYEQAYTKCEAQLARVNERKAKVGC